MQHNRSCDTKPELAFGRLLWSSGIRYRKHPKDVLGRPDFCIKKYLLAMFVDGEFWHGRNWERNRGRFKSNRQFWLNKIERNMARDKRVNTVLRAHGWTVLRFWESDIRRSPGVCLRRVLDTISAYNGSDVPTYIPADTPELSAPEFNILAGSDLCSVAAEPQSPYGAPD